MAEKGAHLTGTTYIRPSIFEIIAQKSLASTLEPAFKKILSVQYIVSYDTAFMMIFRKFITLMSIYML